MAEKSPAYLMYPDDILASGRVNSLEPLEELWYRRAIDLGWKNLGMPSDPSDFAGWVGRGCTPKAAEKIIKKMYVPHKKDPSKVINERQEKERKILHKKRKQKSDAGKVGMRNRWKQTGKTDNNVITDDNISIPISIPISREEEEGSKRVNPPAESPAKSAPMTEPKKPEKSNGVSGHPAVVVYEEIFGPPNAGFAKAITVAVSDLGLWSNLVTEKASYEKPEKWILGEYHKRVAESPVDKSTGRTKTAREFAREAMEQMEKGPKTNEK